MDPILICCVAIIVVLISLILVFIYKLTKGDDASAKSLEDDAKRRRLCDAASPLMTMTRT
uniref:Uncharacterized protein n=1 Tax=Romanomermis culicivorax TaxID=13658 RepID=A0A915K136_ROMCU